MIDHTGITVSNLERSRTFYLKIFEPLGVGMLPVQFPGVVGFCPVSEAGDPGGGFWITEGIPLSPRLHIAFSASGAVQVDAFHAAALTAGGTDNGPPGLRPHYHSRYYAAFVLDPDGYNIEAVFHRFDPQEQSAP